MSKAFGADSAVAAAEDNWVAEKAAWLIVRLKWMAKKSQI